MYRLVFRFFFKPLEPEFAHHVVVFGLSFLSKVGLLRAKKSPRPITELGLNFENRLGMAAGFDKNGEYIRPLHALGFGHIEIGTITAIAQPGNPKPRMFRLPDQRALINRMGFNNQGALAVSRRIQKLRERHDVLPIIGINIGKSKVTEAHLAAADYRASAKLLAPVADYLVVNVSSPNTPGLRDLQQVQELGPILSAVLAEAGSKPVLVKIAPDLADQDVLSVLELVKRLGLSGVVIANTTIKREVAGDPEVLRQAGGLSGPMLRLRATEMLELARAELKEGYTIISVGGLETQEDARNRIALGANLLQAYTGFVYGGPFWARRITRGL
ncbi:quinone-dependent dihydroorotate dehydrogenase [Candidatus Aquiluna sp. UB-MaderosW2red]|uniref:quinone-dependent dihydroorotate dehydrogenase n=1 Tax=Candidatus Aquiluna sp. UB-MaderosW2red TaxID=1855377 RepID=UPI000B882BB2|nr:quinone-dependent dihydroorotate dehydrogenase [Candidatus Aquiluna sp. UB-MaderosW2red]